MSEDDIDFIIFFAIPLVINGIIGYYRIGGMEKVHSENCNFQPLHFQLEIPLAKKSIGSCNCMMSTTAADIEEHGLKIAKRNLAKAEKGRNLLKLSIVIVVISTYLISEAFYANAEEAPVVLASLIVTIVLLIMQLVFDDSDEKTEVKQIEKLVRAKRSEENRKAEREKEATEKAEYKAKKAEYRAEQIEKAMNLKKEGGIENLEKALEILKDYE